MVQQVALEAVIVPLVEALGFLWVGLQYVPANHAPVLRIYIDKPGGITVEDCAVATRQIQAALSVESFWKTKPILEVSSPGVDRLFFSAAQCAEQVGNSITVQLSLPQNGQRNFKGTLTRVEGEMISLLINGIEKVFPFSEIKEARLVPLW
jgi:ribosome maturation factor RimP